MSSVQAKEIQKEEWKKTSAATWSASSKSLSTDFKPLVRPWVWEIRGRERGEKGMVPETDAVNHPVASEPQLSQDIGNWEYADDELRLDKWRDLDEGSSPEVNETLSQKPSNFFELPRPHRPYGRISRLAFLSSNSPLAIQETARVQGEAFADLQWSGCSTRPAVSTFMAPTLRSSTTRSPRVHSKISWCGRRNWDFQPR